VLATAPAANQHLRFSGTDWRSEERRVGKEVSGTLADARLSANVPLLSANQTFAGSNTFGGVSSLTNINNRLVGAFFGNGAGLTHLTLSSTNSNVTLAGDATGASRNTTAARLRGVNVLATAPAANQHLRFSGTDW